MNKNIIYAALVTLLIGFIISCSDSDKWGISNLAVVEASKSGKNLMFLTLNDVSTLQLNLTVMPVGAEVPPVSYRAYAGDEYFTVSTTGLLTAKKIGVDTLEIKTEDGSNVSVWYEIRVTDHIIKVASITVKPNFVTTKMTKGKTVDISKEITINPAEATDKSVTYKSKDAAVATVDDKGLITAVGEIGDKTEITITAKDAGKAEATVAVEIVGQTYTYTPIDRKAEGWTSTQSHNRPADAAITNAADSHIDGVATTSLALVKPGKNYGSINVGANEEVFFIVDMKKKETFNFLVLDFRANNTQIIFRPHQISLFGSDDGSAWTLIKENIEIPNAKVGAVGSTGNVLIDETPTSYRYFKCQYTLWDLTGGSTIQISEFQLGLRVAD